VSLLALIILAGLALVAILAAKAAFASFKARWAGRGVKALVVALLIGGGVLWILSARSDAQPGSAPPAKLRDLKLTTSE
jgi:hypothetical protein